MHTVMNVIMISPSLLYNLHNQFAKKSIQSNHLVNVMLLINNIE